MSTNHTEHYHLSQWAPEDKVLHSDFNEDNAIIDKTLAELAATAARSAMLLQYKGDCSIAISYHLGDGTCGAAHPTVFEVTKRPFFFILHGAQTVLFCAGMLRGTCIHPGADGKTAVIENVKLTWNEANRTFSFYADTPQAQANVAGTTYEIIEFHRPE